MRRRRPLHLLVLLACLAAAAAAGCRPAEAPAPAPAPDDSVVIGESDPAEAALMNETVLYVLADGVARRTPTPEGEASMRIAADERYRILVERAGWYRLETEWKEIPAWVPASAVRTAEEPAPAHVINERLAAER